MSRDTKVVLGIVIAALLCSSIPVIIPLVFGIGVQGGAWSNQLIHSIVFLAFTKLSGLYILVSVTGLGLSFYFRKRNPRKFRLTSVSFAMLLLGTILTAILSAWIADNKVQFGIVYSSVSCVSALAQVASWAIILFVVFSKRFTDSMDEIP